jgi:hypothetical protein
MNELNDILKINMKINKLLIKRDKIDQNIQFLVNEKA